MAWDQKEVGEIVALMGGVLPPLDPAYRFVVLSANDPYNAGALVGESVSGSFPLTIATAQVDVPGSTFHGQTIHLANTEGRYLVGGEVAGIVRMDQMQGHEHDAEINRDKGASGSARATFGTSGDVTPSISGPTNDGVHGDPRIGFDTHGKDISVVYVLRVL